MSESPKELLARVEQEADRVSAARERVFRMFNKAMTHRNERKYARATSVLEQALEIASTQIGPYAKEVGAILSHLAWLYHQAGDLERAAALHERAVKVAQAWE